MTELVLEARGLTKCFGAVRATDGASLDLRTGEIHALIGPNGAGKSTLIAQLAGAIAPDAGTIWFAGREVTGLSMAARARAGLGRTFQISSLALDLSARRNVMMAVQGRLGSSFRFWRRARQEAALVTPADAALARVGLGERAHIAVGTLSHGERRLVEVAAALALEPRLLLLDEPMAGLGLDGTEALTQLLAKLRDECPILLIEHDMDAVFRLADRISVLVSGRVIATGPPATIREDPAVQAAYLGTAA
ncbi:MAG: ABC transporter ATP-binding protein [Pseudomonadota bacterium]